MEGEASDDGGDNRKLCQHCIKKHAVPDHKCYHKTWNWKNVPLEFQVQVLSQTGW